jgi:hypothetical protein
MDGRPSFSLLGPSRDDRLVDIGNQGTEDVRLRVDAERLPTRARATIGVRLRDRDGAQ